MSKVHKILDEVLGEEKKTIDIKSLQIIETEHPSTDIIIHYEFNDDQHDNPNEIQNFGDGFVDALVNGFVDRFEDDYKSLKNLKLCRFEVNAKIKKNLETNQSDAKVVVEIGIKTPSSKEILFKEIDKSLVRAGTKVVRNAVEFMINCEEAVKKIHFALQDAKSRDRMDSVDKYTSHLIELVKITSYESVLN